MNESEGDVASLGILALRHHDRTDVRGAAWGTHDRLINYAATFEAVNEDSLLRFRPVRDTLGPVLGGIAWPFDPATDRKMREWSWAWPAAVDETPGTGTQSGLRFRPAHRTGAQGWELSSPETDKLGSLSATSPDGRSYPKGYPGLVVAASDLGSSQACFVPAGGVLVAPHRGGTKTHGTLVHDVSEDGELDDVRAAHLQSLLRVYETPAGGLYGPEHEHGLSIQLDLARKGGMAGRAVFAGRPKGTPQGLAVNLGDNGAPGQVHGAGSYRLGGPFCVGSGRADKHRHGVNADGDDFGPLHLDVKTLYHLDNEIDAPNKHSGFWPPKVGPPKGKLVEVYWAYDPVDTHTLPTGTFQGLHKWYTAFPVYPVDPTTVVIPPTYVTPQPPAIPQNPPTFVTPQPPQLPPTFVTPQPPPGGPGVTDDGPGVTDGGPGVTVTPGPDEPQGPVNDGPNIDARGPGGYLDDTGGVSIGGAPVPGGTIEVTPTGGTAFGVPTGTHLERMLEILRAGGVLLTGNADTSGPQLQGYVASTGPFATPAILARPTSQNPGADNSPDNVDKTSPIVLRQESSGPVVDTGWDYTVKPGAGDFPGGTARGILWTMQPENTLGRFYDGETTTATSGSGSGYADDGSFEAWGTPLENGKVGDGWKVRQDDDGNLEWVETDGEGEEVVPPVMMLDKVNCKLFICGVEVGTGGAEDCCDYDPLYDSFAVSPTLNLATANNTRALAVGPSAAATFPSTTAVGNDADATATRATALGTDSEASAPDATALGRLAIANGDQSVAVGASSSAGLNDVAVGYLADAAAAESVAVGSTASVKAGANQSVVVGAFAESFFDSNTVVGYSAEGNSSDGVAVGWLAESNATGAVAIGYSSVAAGDIAVGNFTSSSGAGSVAVGGSSVAALGSTSIGESSSAASSSTALGRFASAAGSFSVAIAGFSSASGSSSISIGDGSTAQANGSIALGDSADATVAEAIAIGNAAQATGTSSLALGRQAAASGDAAIALGRASSAGANALVAGSTAYYLTSALIGGGDGDDNARALNVRTSNALSANTAGWAFSIHAGRGRGTGAGGAFAVYTSPPGAAGATLNTDDVTFALTHQAVTIGRLATVAAANQIQKGGASVPFFSEQTTCGANGQLYEIGTVTENLVLSLVANTTDTTVLIPAGSRVLGVTARITTTITGLIGPTNWKVGTAAAATAFVGNQTTLIAGTTVVGLNHVATTNEVIAAATAVRVTVANGPATAGAIRLTVHFLKFTPPTS